VKNIWDNDKLKPSRQRKTDGVLSRLVTGLQERDSNTDSHAFERDTMRTQKGGISGWGFICVSLPGGLYHKQQIILEIKI